jgi:hypothetical protein
MDNIAREPYEAPKVIVSLDALDMITDADGVAVGAGVCGPGSNCTFTHNRK